MLGPRPLPGGGIPATVILDGSGNGIAFAGPARVREHWQATGASVSVATNNSEASAKVFKGSAFSSATFVGSTAEGSTGATCGLAGMDVQPGESIWAQWSNGDPGALATMVIFGTYTIGAPQL